MPKTAPTPPVKPPVSEIDTGEAYDDLRMICADVTMHLGAALAHGSQALEIAEQDDADGESVASEWDDAQVNLDRAVTRILDAQELCILAAAKAKEAA